MRRFITLITPESEGEKSEEALPVDLRTLRAIRVLRPLKLVSGVPSKFFPSIQDSTTAYTRFQLLLLI